MVFKTPRGGKNAPPSVVPQQPPPSPLQQLPGVGNSNEASPPPDPGGLECNKKENEGEEAKLLLGEPLPFSLVLGPPPEELEQSESARLYTELHKQREEAEYMKRELHQLMQAFRSAVVRPGTSTESNNGPQLIDTSGMITLADQVGDGDGDGEVGEGGLSRRITNFPWFGLGNNNNNTDPDDEDNLMDTLPEDSFSLLLVSKACSIPFMAALLIYTVQVCTFLLLTFNTLSIGSSNPFNIPANIIPSVRGSQIIALSITVLTQDDVRTGVSLFYKGYTIHTQRAFDNISHPKFLVTTLMRIIEGALGLMVTFILIITASTVIDLLLNFTAMEFVSQLDEIFFSLASQGFVGKDTQDHSELVSETKFLAVTVPVDSDKPEGPRKKKESKLHLILGGIWALLMSAWTIVMLRQTGGDYLCQTLQVQFEDDFVSSLGAFSGLYDLDSGRTRAFENTRVKYIDRQSGRAMFAFCSKMKAWTFSFAEDGHFPDPFVDGIAHSDDSASFDVLETSGHEWTVRNPDDREILIDHFHLSCMDCDRARLSSQECQGRGVCSESICDCDEGWYGVRCEFHEPCTGLEMDVRYDGFVDFRSWSSTYQIFELEGQEVTAYNRPVYISEPKPGKFDLVVFIGRRWMATHSDILTSAGLDGYSDPAKRRYILGHYFLDHFHAYWSDFVATFVTQPMDIGHEQNAAEPVGFEWYLARPKSVTHPHDVQGIDRSIDRLDAVLLCAVCNEENNECLNDGVCLNGQCECSIGSFGSLCQIPPIGNGRCDPRYDVPKYDYDGGDCCESTCISGDVFHCGKDETGFIDVGYFFCVHEADEWHLNRASFENIQSQPRYSLSLSADGHILAVGEPNADHVTLYDADGSQWTKRGRVIEGPLGSHFGGQIAMSRGLSNTVRNPLVVDPVRIAVSGRFRNQGFLRVYECLAQGCVQSGDDIFFDSLLPESQTVHDLSGDGRILAFGGYDVNSNMTKVQFYHYEEELHQWRPEGIPSVQFVGDAYSLTLSATFDTLGVRSMIIYEDHTINGSSDEYHRLFLGTDAKGVFHLDKDSMVWEQLGHTIFDAVDGSGSSPNPDDFHILGTRHRLSEFLHGSNSISISGDGKKLAVGFPFSKHDAGVRVYTFDSKVEEWFIQGPTISNSIVDGFKGWSVAVSDDGGVVVVGTGGEETATNTYLWDSTANTWVKYGHELPGGEQSSLAVSADGSVLAVGHHTVDVYHRNLKTKCPSEMALFHLSLTMDTHPEDTRWDVVSNATHQTYLSGGPYVGSDDGGFPYSGAYERTTIVAETCIPRDECMVFSLYDKIDPLVDIFKIPDGMLTPSVYNLSIDGMEYATRRLDQAVDHIYIGDSCTKCPDGTHALKVLVRSCVPYSWELHEDTVGFVLAGNNAHDFSSNFEYIRDGTCQHLGLAVHTYWEETCLDVGNLDRDCFEFQLEAHPDWPVVRSSGLGANSSSSLDLDSGSSSSPGFGTNSPGLGTNSSASPGLGTNSSSFPDLSTNSSASPGLDTSSSSFPDLSTNSSASPGLDTNSSSFPDLSTNSSASTRDGTVSTSNVGAEEELDHAHRNTEVVVLFDDQQIRVDLALVGSINAGPPSKAHFRFGGACAVEGGVN